MGTVKVLEGDRRGLRGFLSDAVDWTDYRTRGKYQRSGRAQRREVTTERSAREVQGTGRRVGFEWYLLRLKNNNWNLLGEGG